MGCVSTSKVVKDAVILGGILGCEFPPHPYSPQCMLHLFATTQQDATWDKANLLLLQQKIPFNGDYAPGTIFPIC